MRLLFILILALFTFQLSGQSVLNFDTYEANDDDMKVLFDTLPLNKSKLYNLEVVGTYSAWNPSYWSAPCGEVTEEPMFPSSAGPMTGNVGFDFEYGFSYPTNSLCNGATFPFSSVRFEISLDNGETWFHPITSEMYNSDHIYNYEIEGLGFPLGVRHISPYNSDDYGVLQFTVTQESSFDVKEKGVKKLMLYPNPATNEIKLTQDFTSQSNYTIYNTLGRVVLSGEYSGAISIDQLSNGSYFIELLNDTKIYRAAFVKY